MSEWISVRDRLPESRKKVLVYAGGGIYGIYVVAERDKMARLWRATWDNDIIKSEYVTHWMPLPEPPKEDDA